MSTPPDPEGAAQAYLEALARSPQFVYVDAERYILLTQVYVMLEALPRERPTPSSTTPPDELAPMRERREHADLPPLPAAPSPQLLKEVLAHNQHLVILGEPGAGKSTVLQYIALCCARREQASELGIERACIPIRVPLQPYSTLLSSGGDAMLQAMAREVAAFLQISPEQARGAVVTWGEQGRLVLLLDGLDEVYSGREKVRDQIESFAASPLGCANRIVVTSRPTGYATLGDEFAEFTLKPLQGPQEARHFLERWLGALRPEWDAADQAQQLVAKLEAQPALRRLLDNPLILRLAAYQYARTGEVARNRAGLYAAYLDEAWERAVRRMVPEAERETWRRREEARVREACLRAAEALAWHFHTDGRRDEPSARQALVQRGAAQDAAEAQERLEWLRKGMGLVVCSGGELVFSHSTFREYLVACRLQRAWERDADRTWRFLRPRLHLPTWREPLQLLGAALPPAQGEVLLRRVLRARSAFEPILHRDLFLAAQLIGAGATISAPLQREVQQRLARVLQSEHEGWSSRRKAAEALGEIGPQALPHLLQALQDEDVPVREAAAEALGKIGPQALPDLRQALQDDIVWVRLATVEVLEKIGPQALPDLRQALQDDEVWVRWATVEVLEKIGPQALPDLRQALQDFNAAVRRVAVGALGEIGDPQALPHLRQALQDANAAVRRKAAAALGKIGPQALPDLRQALQDEDVPVRWAAAQALGEIGDPQALPDLRQALQDADAAVRRAAVGALGKIGPQALPDLRQALQDADAAVRRAAAQALGEIVRAWPLAQPGEARKRQREALQSLIHPLLKGSFLDELEVVLERLAEIEAAATAFDPLAPAPPGVLRRAGGWVLWGLLTAVLLGLLGLLGVFLLGAQDALKGIWERTLGGQPVLDLVLLVFVLAALSGLGGWAVERLKKRIIGE